MDSHKLTKANCIYTSCNTARHINALEVEISEFLGFRKGRLSAITIFCGKRERKTYWLSTARV
jgi:hypothetical protein